MSAKTVTFVLLNQSAMYCKVCGLKLDFNPWGVDGKSPTYEICPCCGVEFGNEDFEEDSTIQYRKEWIQNGCNWFKPASKPQNWSADNQLKNIAND